MNRTRIAYTVYRYAGWVAVSMWVTRKLAHHDEYIEELEDRLFAAEDLLGHTEARAEEAEVELASLGIS